MTTALFIGRFQPFHNAHLQVIKDILKECDKIIIVVGSSQFSNEKDNPFSYEERKTMIEQTLKENKIKNYEIHPVPDFFDDSRWAEYILTKIPKFDTFYSGNEIPLKIFNQKNIKTKKIGLIKGVNGTEIRKKIANEEGWKHLVPKTISAFVEKINGVERIKTFSAQNG